MKVDNLSTYRQYPEPLRVRVKEVFQDRAQGTFLWVGIVAEVLRKYKATEVEKALDLFPSSLEELYARILLQIDVDRRKIAAKILRWVVMAVRPLTLSELSIAIETTVGPTVVAFSRDKVTRDQVSYCGYFLTIKEDQVDLIHQSAKDYLLRRTRDPNPELEAFRVKEEVANIEIARKCFDYLHNSFLPNGEIDLLKNATHLKAFPLLSYAVVHWPEHARSLARSEDIFDLSLPFYNEQSQVRMSWLKTYWALNEYGDPPNSFTPLHLASYFGILPLAENLLLKKGMINKVKRLLYLDKKDGNGQTALNRAARGGHEAVSQLLLLKGADVEARDGEGETALFWAVRGGHETVVRLLLENGADVEAKRNDGWWRALLRAAWVEYDAVGHQALKAYLTVLGIEEWLDVGEPALFWAAWDGHEAIVRLLLEKGADVEARANNRRTALIGAAGGGHEAVVRLLLEKGADVEARANDGRTALIGAAEGGHEAVLRLLLEKGANVEARDNDGWTALIEAAGGGDEVVMQLLLEKGADVEARDNDGWTALFWAARGGHEAVVRLLLEKGADVEARDNDGWTALIRAAWFGHKAIGHEAVKQLLKARLMEKTADVEARDNDGETALMGTTRGAI
jgi:ankyrin repeat protein